MNIPNGSWQALVLEYLENPTYKELNIDFSKDRVIVKVNKINKDTYNSKNNINIVELAYTTDMSVIVHSFNLR